MLYVYEKQSVVAIFKYKKDYQKNSLKYIILLNLWIYKRIL